MARFRSVRRARGKRRETYWSTVLIQQDSVDSGAVSSQNLADRDDWTSGTSSFEKGGVLERIRGNISILSGAVSSAGGAVFMAIWLVNDDETAPNPLEVLDYQENDCIWAGVVNFQSVTLTAVGGWSNPANIIDIDVKSRRKLTSQSIVLFTWRAVGGSSDEQAIMSAVFRTLTSAP